MNYEDRIVCFIDILGFKEIINNTIDKDGEDISPNIDILENAFQRIRFSLDINSSNQISKSKIVTQFSDCIVISFKITEESEIFYTLIDIQNMLINLVFIGVICRGAIVRGKIIHTADMIFGPGLNEAYILESKSANHPRIILDKHILELACKYHASHHLPRHELESIESILGHDSDGFYYIDYFQSAQSELDDPMYDFPLYLDKLSSIISKGLKSPKPDVRAKYYWLKQKYNKVALEYQEKCDSLYTDDIDLRDAYHSLEIFE